MICWLRRRFYWRLLFYANPLHNIFLWIGDFKGFAGVVLNVSNFLWIGDYSGWVEGAPASSGQNILLWIGDFKVPITDDSFFRSVESSHPYLCFWHQIGKPLRCQKTVPHDLTAWSLDTATRLSLSASFTIFHILSIMQRCSCRQSSCSLEVASEH